MDHINSHVINTDHPIIDIHTIQHALLQSSGETVFLCLSNATVEKVNDICCQILTAKLDFLGTVTDGRGNKISLFRDMRLVITENR